MLKFCGPDGFGCWSCVTCTSVPSRCSCVTTTNTVLAKDTTASVVGTPRTSTAACMPRQAPGISSRKPSGKGQTGHSHTCVVSSRESGVSAPPAENASAPARESIIGVFLEYEYYY